MREEQWRPVVGHEGYYEVSDQGRVRSLGRMANRGRAGWRWMNGQILKRNRSNGRYMVALSVNGDVRRRHIGPLVLEAFVGPCPPGMECCHWDDNPANDTLGNLRWDTPANNKADELRNGHNHHATKIRCPRGHDLFPPNLTSGTGDRECLACNRTKSWARRLGIDSTDPRWTAEANRRYADITGRHPTRHNRDKTQCKRTHDLRPPNLIQHEDRRECLACARTSSWATYRGIPRSDPRWGAESDRRYAQIMSDA